MAQDNKAYSKMHIKDMLETIMRSVGMKCSPDTSDTRYLSAGPRTASPRSLGSIPCRTENFLVSKTSRLALKPKRPDWL